MWQIIVMCLVSVTFGGLLHAVDHGSSKSLKYKGHDRLDQKLLELAPFAVLFLLIAIAMEFVVCTALSVDSITWWHVLCWVAPYVLAILAGILIRRKHFFSRAA